MYFRFLIKNDKFVTQTLHILEFLIENDNFVEKISFLHKFQLKFMKYVNIYFGNIVTERPPLSFKSRGMGCA